MLAGLLCATLAVVAVQLAAAAAPAQGYANPDVVTPTSGGGYEVAPQAEEWLRQYGPDVEAEWNTQPHPQAPADRKKFVKKLFGKYLPKVGKVIPYAGAVLTAYEVCSAFVQKGCWLFSRDDRSGFSPAGYGRIFYPEALSDRAIGPSTENPRKDQFGNTASGPAIYPGISDRHKGDYLVSIDPEHIPSGDGANGCPRSALPQYPAEFEWIGLDHFDTGGSCRIDGVTTSQGLFRTVAIHNFTEATYAVAQADNPSVPNRTTETVPSDPNWRSTLGTSIATDPDQDWSKRVQDYIDSTPPSDPYPLPLQTVPSCEGVSYNVCVQRIQDAGFGVYHRHNVGPSEQIPVPQGEPHQVVGTSPAAGATVATDTDVRVDTNPADSELYRLVPAFEGEGAGRESAEDYAYRLEHAPYNLPTPTRNVSTPENSDPSTGPGAVHRVLPPAGSRVPPDQGLTTTENPPDWPAPPPGGDEGGVDCSPPTLPAIDFSPLEVDVAGEFPFGIFAWVAAAFGDWATPSAAPTWSIPVLGDTLDLDFEQMEPFLAKIRPGLLILSYLGLAWFFATSLLGFGQPQTED